jgi:hypothetical protein
MEIPQKVVEAGTIVTALEQRIKSGENFTGEAPSLAGEVFSPFFDSSDNVARFKQTSDPTKDKGDKGGLFEWTAIGPTSVEYIIANFGGSVSWVMSIVTRTGDQVDFASGSCQYVLRREYDRFYMFPGDKIKIVTTGGAAAMVVRVGVTLSTGIH